jgi:cysteine desulfurase
MSDPLYLDHNASTPTVPRVREVAARALAEGFGNPSAGHVYGRRARAFVDTARAQVARLIGCDPDEILFTGGGTEASNLAIRGFAAAHAGSQVMVLSSRVEHPAVTEPVRSLPERAPGSALVDVDETGAVLPEVFRRALVDGAHQGPTLVSVMLAQNETGVLQPVSDIARLARARGAVVHTDAVQAVGKVPVDVRALGVDMLSIAGHKLYAPKGVGALYVRRGTPLASLLVGAEQERGLRPGTENVSGIAALGEACAMALEDLEREAARQRGLRNWLEAELAVGGFVVHGARAERLPNTCNGHFPGVRGAALLEAVPELAFTTGSACHSGDETPSAILTAMGIGREEALGAIRISIGRGTSDADVERAARLLLRAAAAPPHPSRPPRASAPPAG